MYVKPNRPTPDPERSGYLPDDGRTVEPTPYWLRRIADGDVTEVKPPAPPPAGPPPAQHPDQTEEPADAGSSVSGPRSTRNLRKGPQP